MKTKKFIVFLLYFILLSNCSFDNKTGIWKDSKKQRAKIEELEKKQRSIIKTTKIYSSEVIYNKEVYLDKKIILSKPKKNLSWTTSSLNQQNSTGHMYLSGFENIFLKKKIGKNKFLTYQEVTNILAYEDSLVFSDDKGTIYNINKFGTVIWKKNIYSKNYKKLFKSLRISIIKNNLYVSDNLGFVYLVNLYDGNLVWVRNFDIPGASYIKVSKNYIFLIDQDNKILCINPKNGNLIWDLLSISSFIKSNNLLSLGISDDGFLFANTSSADLYKINPKTGQVVWSSNTAESLYSNATDFYKSSQILIEKDEIIYSSGKSTFSQDVRTGAMNWKSEISSVGAPIVDGNNIFIVTENGYFAILDRKNGNIISSSNIFKILKKRKQKTKVTSFLLASNKIIAITSNGNLIVSSAISGKPEFFKKMSNKTNSQIIINDGSLYLLTEKSKIIGIN
jgi:outer membrane protein assembly factor BamB